MHLVGFTGTRAGCTKAQHAAMAKVLFEQSRMSFARLDHGCCDGADREAHAVWRRHRGVVRFRPGNRFQYEWAVEHCQDMESVFGVMPYLERNRLIADECAVLVACPAEMVEVMRSGTWATIRAARRVNRAIYLVRPDGSVTLERASDATRANLAQVPAPSEPMQGSET